MTAKGKEKQQCTAKLVSGVVTFHTAADEAILTRGRTVYATGTSASLAHG